MSIQDKYSIAFWGPPSSGKTWLIRALAKKFLDYADNEDFFFEIRDKETNTPVESSPPLDIRGTEGMSDKEWVFRRIAKQKTKNHLISEYEHHINVRDDKGAATFDLYDDEHESTRLNLANSDYILVMLDPTLLDKNKPPSPEEPNLTTSADILDNGNYPNKTLASATRISKSQYADRVRLLFDTLISADSGRQYHIAICVTKVDTLGVRGRDPWELISMFFGKEMATLVKQYAQNPCFVIETFSISAFGFIRSQNLIPNSARKTEDGSDTLLKPDQWRPYNVDAPFFWLFEHIERERLKNKASGVFGSLFFNNERLEQYIPYPIRRQ